MISIKHKIIFSNLAVVILAGALISVSVVNMQMSTIKESVSEMSGGARGISKTGGRLAEISSLMRSSVLAIGEQIDLLKS